MPTYRVPIVRISCGYVEIEADTPEEAAQTLIDNDDLFLCADYETDYYEMTGKDVIGIVNEV